VNQEEQKYFASGFALIENSCIHYNIIRLSGLPGFGWRRERRW